MFRFGASGIEEVGHYIDDEGSSSNVALVDTWLIVVTVLIAVVVLALVLRGATRGRERRLSEQPGLASPTEEQEAPRDKLAKDAGVASFGLNLPWRRPRGVSSGHRARR